MSKIDELIAGINPSKKNPNKEKLWEFVKESLEQIGQINEEYKKYFEKRIDENIPTVFEDIEEKISKIKNSYIELFAQGDGEESMVVGLNKKINEIKEYHVKLLDGDKSIKSNIDEANQKIREFYEYLCGNEEDDGIEPSVREAITTILKSKQEISDFEAHLNEKIKPALEEMQGDITLKRKEINALLSNATATTLANAYAESKFEYSIPAIKDYKSGKIILNIGTWVFNIIGRYIGYLFNHALFIVPIIFVSLIFTNEHVAQIILNSINKEGGMPSIGNLIYIKTAISIPLIWIAWYGQRNLSQRKRLSEEYNHKLRVVQMYLMFITNEQSYKLDNKRKLERILLDAIKRNPSKVFGKDETMLDKIAEIVRISKGGAEDLASGAVKKIIS